MRSIIALKTSETLSLCSTVVFVYTTSKCLCILRYHESLMTAMAFEKKKYLNDSSNVDDPQRNGGWQRTLDHDCHSMTAAGRHCHILQHQELCRNFFLPYCGYVTRKYQWIPPLFIKIIGCKSMGVSCLCSHKQQFTKTKTCKNCLGLVNWYC